jgi:alpha-L-fucosidase
MNNRTLRRLLTIAIAVVVVGVDHASAAEDKPIMKITITTAEPMRTGKFEPTWESLKQYRCPEWFRDAKFGIWAHWGPQCQPEQGDWYARGMYQEGSSQNKWHMAHYGDPSKFGFKDVIHEWKAQNWDPGKLMALYKRAGAQYFFALANHHDNFDNYNSKYQPWNSVNVGPKKDLIAGWAQAARANGLRFGVSVHAAHAWSWYEPSQKFDGNLTKADGKGLWWEGLDPQDLYAQNHTPGQKLEWDFDPVKGSSIPDAAYCQKFYNRTVDLINKYRPDLIYFDDTALPLWPVSDAGLKIAAHFYNSIPQGVLFGKVLNEEQRQCMTWDIERGASNRIEPLPWQSDTCIGSWHYARSHFEKHDYKGAKTVIHTLADIVSKNGNLLLSIPVRGDGTIDDDEVKVVEGIAQWMDVNRECIFGTRPWKVFGEGPATEGAPIKAQGFNEGKGKPFTAEDVRFTTRGDTLYAIVLGVPTNPVQLKSLHNVPIAGIQLLGSDEKIRWSQSETALVIEPPQAKPASDAAVVFKISTPGI